MAAGGVAGRYAVALFDLAREKKVLAPVLSDLERIHAELARDERFRRLFLHERLDPRAKALLVAQQFPDEVTDLTLKFVGLVAEKRRVYLFSEMVQSFALLVDDANGVVEVIVKTAAKLDDPARQTLGENLESALQRKVRTSVEEVPSLIGGLRLQVGDYVVDGTLSGRLERLGDELRSARIQKAG